MAGELSVEQFLQAAPDYSAARAHVIVLGVVETMAEKGKVWQLSVKISRVVKGPAALNNSKLTVIQPRAEENVEGVRDKPYVRGAFYYFPKRPGTDGPYTTD